VTGEKIHGLIRDLNRALSVSFILVTHDEGLASLGHRRLHMRDGVFES
jgi:predicted ABC-type transport system involved in lysophospholipase L1 biosynthesis ATPase subunit